ncbi:hypothetical protein VR7878_02562 [Vibrio ruber DSM 16370]|uniref:Uncharacterized protein n=1 Tax=Vibrio ruber (strain DSM 16370 / JCM 11486 / BCRC 17186 / CECT 7878 / LMG 23124 / VR1) TaxID=1123498 RepID=A0A1R4LMW0_VIBR1|nr:hypothetical protein VR7878_02562 [Vibrio ruber DSM 16370]
MSSKARTSIPFNTSRQTHLVSNTITTAQGGGLGMTKKEQPKLLSLQFGGVNCKVKWQD